MGLSIRERWAKISGKDKKEFRDSPMGEAISRTENYYKESRKTEKKFAKIDTQRYKEDFKNLMNDLGVLKTQALEDYTTNLGRLRENKETDLETLDYYVNTQTGRAQEDLEDALAKEARRFELSMDRKQRDLASKNLAFSSFGGIRAEEEGLVKQKHEDVVGGLQKEKRRSFQDIQREEFVKNREIEQTFERGKEDTGTTKQRTLADINQQKRQATLTKERGIEDVGLGLDQTLKEYEYQEDESKMNIESDARDYYRNLEKQEEERNLG